MPSQLNIKVFPEKTLIVENCIRYPQYNGVYIMDTKLYNYNNLDYAQWLQIDSNGKTTDRSIIPCIGALDPTFPVADLPTIFSYVLSTANLSTPAGPSLPDGTQWPTGLTWTVWTPYMALEAAALAANLDLYITNIIQFDANGFQPMIIRIPNPTGLNVLTDAAVQTDDPDATRATRPTRKRGSPLASRLQNAPSRLARGSLANREACGGGGGEDCEYGPRISGDGGR